MICCKGLNYKVGSIQPTVSISASVTGTITGNTGSNQGAAFVFNGAWDFVGNYSNYTITGGASSSDEKCIVYNY